MRKIGRRALFEKITEFLEEVRIAVRIPFGFFFEELQKTAGDEPIQFLDERAVLHRLARNIQRQILTVDHTLQEPEPVGKQILRLGVDQDFTTIEADTWLGAAEAELFLILLRDEQEAMDRERRVGAEVQTVARPVKGVAEKFV